MDFKKILGNIGCTALGTIAPPFGGMAANLIKDALGLEQNANEQQIATALQGATPEQVVALKEADHKFKLEMEKLGVDILKLDKEDRDSARQMQVTTRSKVPAILSIFVTIGFFGVLYIMLNNGIPQSGQRDAMLIMLGALGAAFTQVVNFWLGSSNGSKEKTSLMSNK